MSSRGQAAADGDVDRSPALPLLGWKEQVTLPDWGVSRLRAKLDTGARTSALHVESLEVVDADGAAPEACFEILVGSRDRPTRRRVHAPVVGFKVVRDSGANVQRRPVVRTRVTCGPLDTTAEVTVTDRSGMNFRMLLGRVALAGVCVVDPQRGYLVTAPPPRRDRGDQAPDR